MRPDEYPYELRRLLLLQHDVLTRAQALRYMSAKTLETLLTSGRWTWAHRGTYVVHNGPRTTHQQRWIAALAVGGRLAGTTALSLFGLRGYGEPTVHVLVGAKRQVSRPPAAVRVHRTSVLPRGDRTRVDLLPVTTPARALVDAAQWAPSDDRAAALVAACFQQRLVNGPDVEAALSRLPRARRRTVVGGLVRDLAGGANSLPEVEFLRLCRRARLPTPKLQVSRRDAAGRQRYLDGYFEEHRVHVEVDGGQHLDPTSWWADMRRQNDLWIPGDRVLRFPAWVVRTRPDEVLAQVRAALWAAGWRGCPPARPATGRSR